MDDNVAVSDAPMSSAAVSARTVATANARGRRMDGSNPAAASVHSTLSAKRVQPGACCHHASETVAPDAVSTQRLGQRSAGATGVVKAMAQNTPKGASRRRGAPFRGYLVGMLPNPSRPHTPLGRAIRHAAQSAAVAALAASAWSPLAAQSPAAGANTRLDEGSFTVSVNGQRVGREQFSMQQVASPDGATLSLRSEAAVGDRRTAMRLEADSAGTPVRYTIEERRGAELTLRLGGQRVRGRFATLARSLTGEAAREYLLRPGAVVVEDDGLVQYALLVRGKTLAAAAAVTLPSLTPVANAQGVVRIVLEADADIVAIAGARVSARRWRCITNDGDVRLLWADRDGRLLRVSIPSRNLEALRDDVPR
jgi:hypothetical protein